jgi:hypothetical protein
MFGEAKGLCRRRASLAAMMVVVFAGLMASGCGGTAEGASTLEGILPAGEGPDWYWTRMENAGYEVTSINYERDDYVEYEVVKGEDSYEVQLELDSESGKVAGVEITSNPWPASSTKEVLDRNGDTTMVVVPAGTRIDTKLNDYLDSGENQRMDTFSMTVNEPVIVGNNVVVPRGTLIGGHVASVESAERPNKGGRLVLKADSMEVNGERIEFEGIVTAETGQEGDSSIKEDLKEIAIGAGIGGLVGGLIGGGKGVLAGVLIGGGGTFIATKGEQIELPPGAPLIVELSEDVRVSH